jgi:retron-type reverse transcriptase
MSERLANLLNLELAWQRLKFDKPDRTFVTNPYLIELVEQDRAGFLQNIREQITRGYAPSPSTTVPVPKGKWQVRPGVYLRLGDELVFNALVGSVFQNAMQRLQWSQGGPDIAYQLANLSTAVKWVKRGYLVWAEWREKSLEKLQTAEFVLIADIAAFYENIDLARLFSDLRALNMDEEAATLLSACLNRWAEPRGKGIPQGHTSSDILAKLYLDSVDHNLRNAGFTHLRYVDDIRIFCNDLQDAKKALLQISELLRIRGLNVQSAKTRIFRSDEALREIDGVTPVVERINQELREEIQAYAGGEYGTIEELEQVTAENPEHPPQEVLERAFRSHFIDAHDIDFDPTLFHYLLTRLGATGSRIAVDYCIAILSKRPEETEHILRYVGKVESAPRDDDRIFAYLETPDALYSYQVFLVLRHYFERQSYPNGLITYCRKALRDPNMPAYVKAFATAILGEGGEDADLEFIEAQYALGADEVQRATIICSCHRMEAGRRNAFFGRARNDGNIEQRAVTWARGREPRREQDEVPAQ